MTASGAPVRFLVLLGGGWTGGRIVALLPSGGSILSGGGTVVVAAGMAMAPVAIEKAREIAARPAAAEEPATAPAERPDRPWIAPEGQSVTVALDEEAPAPGWDDPLLWRRAAYQPDVVPPVGQPPAWVAPSPPGGGGSRWSGSAWLFVRENGARGLAAGEQLGGSQAGARLAYRLAGDGSAGLSIAGRVSTPLRDTRGAEGALGLDWHPLRDVPVRVSVERRFAIGPDGRNAWSAYAAGGFYRGGLPGGLELDGYAQAGVVGARRRDLFVDGAVRLGKPVRVARKMDMLVGGGVWGAAQPGVSRLDVGPRAAMRVPVAGATMTAAVEGRVRVAGKAEPGSGAAFTLATDF